MVLKSKPFPSELTLSRRFSIWAQIVIVFVLLEFALWAPTTHLRNRWAAIAAIARRYESPWCYSVRLN